MVEVAGVYVLMIQNGGHAPAASLHWDREEALATAQNLIDTLPQGKRVSIREKLPVGTDRYFFIWGGAKGDMHMVQIFLRQLAVPPLPARAKLIPVDVIVESPAKKRAISNEFKTPHPIN